MTEEELKNKISEHKECSKKLAEEYRQRYNEDNTDKLALNMFYHNVIAYNNFETVLATIEDRNSMIMCFSNPPILTEETVEVDIKRIEVLEKENKALGERCLQLQKDKGNLTDEVKKLKILVSSLVYEINQIWDINEMNDDLRMCAEKIDREVQLSKMAEDNRMVISALGFAIVPPKPKLDVKEV
jgi:hypothetical protein